MPSIAWPVSSVILPSLKIIFVFSGETSDAPTAAASWTRERVRMHPHTGHYSSHPLPDSSDCMAPGQPVAFEFMILFFESACLVWWLGIAYLQCNRIHYFPSELTNRHSKCWAIEESSLDHLAHYFVKKVRENLLVYRHKQLNSGTISHKYSDHVWCMVNWL